ncbi:MAG: CDP-alcohol phosphatidyltransferase family protein [Gemmatimonadales bacterium]|nr:CDP-alcohol phosphatidyltransferase family protein [Gemmatimonadales bacterium]
MKATDANTDRVGRAAVILARTPEARSRLWGMTLIERLLRQLSAVGVRRAVVLTPLDWTDRDALLRPDFGQWTDIEVSFTSLGGVADVDAVGDALAGVLADEATPTVVLDGHLVVDTRIIRHLAEADSPLRFAAESGLVAALSANSWDSRAGVSSNVPTVSVETLESYLQSTRKHVRPVIIPVHDADSMRSAKRETFAAVYKGATDFVTKWVFFLPTRWIVGRISPTLITPNQITLVSMVLSFGAIVPFFLGWYGVAVIMGFTMALLDTVDGKLARTTLRTSDSGELLDHVSDTAYLLLWYVGLGWSLSGGNLLDFENPAARMHALLLGTFIADKLLTGLYKRIYGFELHDYTALDYTARIFIARRNPFLLGMVVALVVGQPLLGLQIIAIWYALTLAFHLVRFVYLPLARIPHQSQVE